MLADAPQLFWRLADTGTDGVVTDETGNGRTGRFTAPITLNWPGALGGSGSSAGSALYSASSSTVMGGSAIAGPNTFSAELWFRTTTLQGGKLIGFGSQPSGTSTQYDRHLYLSDSGQLYAGVHNGSTGNTVNTTAAYNDGAWHYAAVVFSAATGLQLYVDGELAASNPTYVTAQAYSGYWRVGGDSLTAWPSTPTNHYFAGAIDEAAVYDKVLAPAQVRGHYRSRNRTG